MLKLIIIFLLVGCGSHGKKAAKGDLAKLKDRYEHYLVTSERPDPKDCDWLLFASLEDFGRPTTSAPIEDAREAPGKWLRRPLTSGNCYPDESKSEISRDMLLGLMFYILKTQQLKLAEDLAAYGEANDWFMGEGEVTRTEMTPQLIGTLYMLIYRLGGTDDSRRYTPMVFPPVEGYQAHLAALHVLLRGLLKDEITEVARQYMSKEVDRRPDNTLFRIVEAMFDDGNYKEPIKQLLAWPEDPPTPQDGCEHWVWQRDEPGPACDGSPWIFAAGLILN